MQILISFCNTPPLKHLKKQGISPLALLDTKSHMLYWVPIGSEKFTQGLTGICVGDSCIFIAHQRPKDMSSLISVLDKKTLKLLRTYDLPKIVDAHSLAIFQHELFVVSTGTDTVYAIPIQGTKLDVENTRKVWQPIGSSGRSDTHHINAVYSDKSKVVISAFGKKKGKMKSSARDGYIYDITHNSFLLNHISHPHAVVLDQKDIMYCESMTRTVHSKLYGSLQFRVGYIRGLGINKNMMVVGKSTGRKHSRSTGKVNNIVDSGVLLPSCAITCISLPKKSFTDPLYIESLTQPDSLYQYSFNEYFKEIYDLEPCSHRITIDTSWKSVMLHREHDISEIQFNSFIEKAPLNTLKILYTALDKTLIKKEQFAYDAENFRAESKELSDKLAFEKYNVKVLTKRIARIESSIPYKIYNKLKPILQLFKK